MSAIQTYTTEGLLPPQRVEYWNDCVGSHITSIETKPADLKSFHGRLVIGDCAFVTIADATSTPACNTHAEKLVNQSTERALLLHLQKAGESLNSQDGRAVLLRKGDFTLCDSARQFEVSFTEPHQILVVRIPEREMLRRLPYVENLMCVHMPGTSGINGVVFGLISKYWSLCQNGLEPMMKERISENVLDLLATTYSEIHNASVAESCLITSRRLLIKEHIERHLSFAELSPSTIARQFGYTRSYIHHLFRGENESISHYILRRRLEEAFKALADECFCSRTIGDIACDWGFNSLTHFGRAFKSKFGLTPSEFRRQCRKPVPSQRPSNQRFKN